MHCFKDHNAANRMQKPKIWHCVKLGMDWNGEELYSVKVKFSMQQLKRQKNFCFYRMILILDQNGTFWYQYNLYDNFVSV